MKPTNMQADSEERFRTWHERQQAINELAAYLRDEPYQYKPLRHSVIGDPRSAPSRTSLK